MEGDLASAKRCWHRACQLRPSCQWKLLPVLAECLSAEQVADFVSLDFDGLIWLARHELKNGGAGSYESLIHQVNEELDSDASRVISSDAWVALFELYHEASLLEKAEHCLRQAVALAPDSPNLQVRLVRCLLERGLWAEALSQSLQAQGLFPVNVEIQALRDEVSRRKPSIPGTTSRPAFSEQNRK
jgi:tetratricopeptide (TPR) repeat protein